MKSGGRSIGALYLLSAVIAGIPLIYVPSTLIVEGNAAATASHIAASAAILRICIVCELIGAILLGVLVMMLHRLLWQAGDRLASIMVTLVLLSVPITFINVLSELAALDLIQGPPFLATIDTPQRDALAMLCLDLHGDGVSLANIFWGLWLLPFGMLVIRSRALPRLIGAWLIADCFGLVAVSLSTLLIPAYVDIVSKLAIPAELGNWRRWFGC